tara:strand:+ start:31 stop:636 length:606 start_codon:yes stop_codon:yes gene_type:complete
MKSKPESRTIPSHWENPLDNVLYDMSYETNKIFKALNFTPNMLTTVSLVLTTIGIMKLYEHKYKLGSILIFLGYCFDCSDGNFARTYSMESQFGDKYDHTSDSLKILLFAIWLYKENTINKKLKRNVVFVLIILSYLAFMHLGCQEKNKKIEQNKSVLGTFIPLCNDKNMISYTRYFGGGTYVLLLCLFVYNIPYLNKLVK